VPVGAVSRWQRSPELEVNVDDDVSAAFTAFYIEAYTIALAIAMGLIDDATASDIAEDVCLELWQAYNADPHGFVPPRNPKAYLGAAVRNRVANVVKERGKREQWQFGFQQMRESDHATTVPGVTSQRERMERALGRALVMLSERQRYCLLKTREDGVTYKVLAAELGISPKTVSNTITAAKEIVRKYAFQFLEEDT
jgi:RNA polymerase sigma-70 factor (ECF subfamily)